MSCLKHSNRLKSKDEFNEAYSSKKRFHTKSFVLFYCIKPEIRVGFTASKRVGNSPQRNFAKRRLRALYLEFCKELKGGYYVFVAKKELVEADYKDLKRDFGFALRKLELLKRTSLRSP